MYVSIMAVALSAVFGAALDTPVWLTDYRSAQRVGKEGGRPLAVVMGLGEAGWEQLSKAGKLDEEVNRVLARNYVCLYIDMSQESGKELASKFEISQDLALVLSDRTGDLQAFRHEGELASPDLAQYLKRYADPDRVVYATENVTPTRFSYYRGSETSRTRNYMQPVFYSTGRSC
jgi:hypothetical protein